jgi:hypothetical protein
MRSRAVFVGIVLLLSSSAFGQSYDLTIHLSNGETVTISHDLIQRIVFTNIPTGVQDPADPGLTPRLFQLLQNFPNPFNPTTTIAYEIPAQAEVTVRIFDLHGALIKELLHESQSAGRHEVKWDGTDANHARVASGAYIYAVGYGEQALSQQLILVK